MNRHVDLPDWTESYPDPAQLRHEADLMRTAYIQSLLEQVPEREIVAIYAKGSTVKPWDSPLDYVPELGDVDIQVLLASTSAETTYLSTLQQSLALLARAEELFHAAAPRPLHIPRPQLIVANTLFAQEMFVPSPPHTTRVIRGAPYPINRLAPEQVRHIDARLLTYHADFLAKLPGHVIDKPAPHLWTILRDLSWRVGPTASRVLSVRGASYLDAWGHNRSHLVRALEDRGEMDLAADYAGFYLHAWEFFLSDRRDSAAGRAAVLRGACVVQRGIDMASGSAPR